MKVVFTPGVCSKGPKEHISPMSFVHDLASATMIKKSFPFFFQILMARSLKT